MELLRDLQQRLGMALIMISHDLGLAASFADEVLVMYAGRAVERAPTQMLFAHVRMPYTRALLDAIPAWRMPRTRRSPPFPASRRTWRCASPAARSRRAARAPPTNAGSTRRRSRSTSPITCGRAGIRAQTGRRGEPGGPLLDVRNLVQEFEVRAQGGVRSGTVQAVSDVSFTLAKGETLGLVGETGSGKSTLARAIFQAPRPKSGEVLLRGSISSVREGSAADARRHVQMVFQDPFGSLDPNWRVARIVEEPLIAFRAARAERGRHVAELLDRVGLDPARYGARRPRALSGGQAQRVAIARALALDPALIIYDEAVSSLDVLIRAQVLNLLERLRASSR